MEKTIKIAVVVAVLTLVLGLFFGDSAEEEILAQLDSLESVVSMPEGEGNVKLVVKQRALEGLLDKPVNLHLTQSVFLGVEFSPMQVSANVVKFKKMYKSVELDFVDVTFINLDEQQAEISFTAHMTVDSKNGKKSDTRAILAELKNSEAGWIFSSFREEEVLQR